MRWCLAPRIWQDSLGCDPGCEQQKGKLQVPIQTHWCKSAPGYWRPLLCQPCLSSLSARARGRCPGRPSAYPQTLQNPQLREHHTRSFHKWTNVYEAQRPVPKIVSVRASVRPGVPVWAVLKGVAVGRTLLCVGARQTLQGDRSGDTSVHGLGSSSVSCRPRR